jgi:hypothetical protein
MAVEGVQEIAVLVLGVLCQVAVGRADHLDARAHPPRQREDAHAGGETPGRDVWRISRVGLFAIGSLSPERFIVANEHAALMIIAPQQVGAFDSAVLFRNDEPSGASRTT